jgi:hypothetical protein
VKWVLLFLAYSQIRRSLGKALLIFLQEMSYCGGAELAEDLLLFGL